MIHALHVDLLTVNADTHFLRRGDLDVCSSEACRSLIGVTRLLAVLGMDDVAFFGVFSIGMTGSETKHGAGLAKIDKQDKEIKCNK